MGIPECHMIDMVCSIDDVSMGLTAHGLLRSLMTSVAIDIKLGFTRRTMGL